MSDYSEVDNSLKCLWLHTMFKTHVNHMLCAVCKY